MFYLVNQACYEDLVILGLPYAQLKDQQNYVIVYSKFFTFLYNLYYELKVGFFLLLFIFGVCSCLDNDIFCFTMMYLLDISPLVI